MPYGTRSRKTSYRRRKPSKPAAPKVKKTVKTYVRKNAYKIADLKRDVMFLKKARHGSIQQNMQTSNSMVPTSSYPLLTDLTDFSCFRDATSEPPVPARQGCLFYQYTPAGLSAAGPYNIQNFLGNPYWQNQNIDQVDTGKYLPVMARYTIRVEGLPSLDNTRVRIQVFQAKASTLVPATNTADALVLPTGLQYLNDLADPTINRLNPIFHKEYRRLGKTMFINSTKTDDQTKGTSGNIFYHTFTIRPKKMKYQAETLPDTPNDPADSPRDGQFGPLQISPNSPLWMIISTDDRTGAIGDSVSVRVSRRVMWRDSIGSAKITP